MTLLSHFDLHCGQQTLDAVDHLILRSDIKSLNNIPQEALWRMRFQIIGNAVLLLLFFLYTLWIRYTADKRPPELQMTTARQGGHDTAEL